MDLQGYFFFVLSDVLLNVGINTERKNVIETNTQRILFKSLWDKSHLIFNFMKVKTFTKFSNETGSKKIVNRYSISTFLCLMLYSLTSLNQPRSIMYFPALKHARMLKLSVSVHESEEMINFESKSHNFFCCLNQITTNQEPQTKPYKPLKN